ncbi:hypothetical protein [Paractinoplanes maris]|uniref:hypothetical protein n=1 Tax=Paractinoplanes maris TaxID=1734446 RepID=UPI0020227AAA|nr:hypothetical protein [Actinoplanes maris]
MFATVKDTPGDTALVSDPAPSVSTSATASPRATVSVAPSLGSAAYVTSPPPPKPKVAPFQGIHVDCEKGDDGNKGTLAKPLRSIRAATSRALEPGAAIGLARGCTWQTTVQLRGDGTKAKPIRLTAYGEGAPPVIDGGSAGSESVVLLSGAYQIVENIRVTDAETNGVEIQGDNSIVRSSSIDNVGVGVLLKARGAAADRVAVRDLHMVRDTPGGNDDYGAIGFSVEASNVEIGRSSCTDCRDTSHDYGHDGGFVEVWNYADDLDVHDNTGSNIQGILEIGGDRPDSSARNIKLRDNTFRNSHGGLVLHTEGDFAIGNAQIAISGNTITSTGSEDPPILDGDLSNVTFEGNTISTASFVSHSAPASHRCNSITLRGGAEVGYQRHSTEKLNGKAAC